MGAMVWIRRCALLLALAAPRDALAQGLAASLREGVATVGEDFEAMLSAEDSRRIVARVEFEVSTDAGATWLVATATQSDSLWTARFSRRNLWDDTRPAQLLLRARLLGPRGGVLLEVEPMTIAVESRAETAARQRLEARQQREFEDGDAFTLNGYVGAEARAGSGSRARLLIGAGGALSARTELALYVSVGPAFAEPSALVGGGPLALGVEAALRGYARAPGPFTTFGEGFAMADFRLPGVDAGGGARVGMLWRLGSELAVEGSLYGALLALRASDPDGRAPTLGAVGGLRFALRLARDPEAP